MCCEYAGNQFVDASFPPFLDDTILSQVFTSNQSINTKLSAFQDNLMNSLMCADSQFDCVRFPSFCDSSRLLDENFSGYQFDHVSLPASRDRSKLLSVKHAGSLFSDASVSASLDGSKPLSVKPAGSLLDNISASPSRDRSKPLSSKFGEFVRKRVSKPT